MKKTLILICLSFTIITCKAIPKSRILFLVHESNKLAYAQILALKEDSTYKYMKIVLDPQGSLIAIDSIAGKWHLDSAYIILLSYRYFTMGHYYRQDLSSALSYPNPMLRDSATLQVLNYYRLRCIGNNKPFSKLGSQPISLKTKRYVKMFVRNNPFVLPPQRQSSARYHRKYTQTKCINQHHLPSLQSASQSPIPTTKSM